jgi:hypothetical protein
VQNSSREILLTGDLTLGLIAPNFPTRRAQGLELFRESLEEL